MKKIQMVDLKSQYLRIKEDIDHAIMSTLNHTSFINGPEVKLFQQNLQNYLKVKHVVPCANGTDAIQIALMALGLKPGDEVITSNFTFISTVEVIALMGLKPVLVDVSLNDFNILAKEIEKKITDRTKAIIPVHLFGQGADMQTINEISKKYSLSIVEDAAQSLGSECVIGNELKKTGTIGDIGCTSFFPSKNLGCFGDGGACMTNDDELALKIRRIANHGSDQKYYHSTVGVNSRLDSIQAAILNVKLKHLDEFNRRRSSVAEYYDRNLKSIGQIQIPIRSEFGSHVFHQYTLRIKDGSRDALKGELNRQGVPAMIYYPVPINQQEVFANLIQKQDFPNSNLLCNEVLSLPMHTEMDEEQLNHIVSSIHKFYS